MTSPRCLLLERDGAASGSGLADRLEARNLAALADREGLGTLLRMAHPTVDHYMPALTIAGVTLVALAHWRNARHLI